mgnify:CR=1 FL=1
MSRLLLLSLLAVAIGALEYTPKADQLVLYRWTTTQTAQWKSAGDDLRYDTRIVWDLALRCAAVNGAQMTVKATFVQVSATHRGPGTDIRVDSPSGAGAGDPLLGHLLLLAGRTLTLEVERTTGRVLTVAGADELIAAINAKVPAAVPGDPPPLDAQARAVYGPEALARLWSQVLALPGSATAVPLPAPFTSGSMTRTWQDLSWTVKLPDGPAPTFELAKLPAAVRGSVTGLSGSGALALAAGLPAKSSGKLAFQLVIDAMTQPVTTSNEVTWELDAQ